MSRGRKLATGSTRDTDWQLKEYARLMGKEAAARQEIAAKAERGDCTCHRRTLRSRGGYRTVHEQHCTKYKPWMEEYLTKRNPAGEAIARSIDNSRSVR
jgi:hypothetical protein